MLTILLWHYQAESIEGAVHANNTGCEITTRSYGGWRDELIAPGLSASRVAYPLQIFVFVDACPDLPEGRPYATELVSAVSGKVIARGISCAGADHAEDYPCRLEFPPISSLHGQDRYFVRVMLTKEGISRTIELRLILKREWRSAVIDAIMSV